MKKLKKAAPLFAALLAGGYVASAAPSFAVWLDGDTTIPLSDGVLGSLDNAFGPGTWTLVSDGDLATAGFLNSFDTLIMSRPRASFGRVSISPAAAANIQAYVGSGASQGGVALFSNDAKDNWFGANEGDPFNANLNQLFVNAATFASATHHGFIGEFNGTVIALDTLGLLPGSADAGARLNPTSPFEYAVGPIGAGHPIDNGVTFPFVDNDLTPFFTPITGADPNTIVDIYTNPGARDYPAVLANAVVIHGVPEATSSLLLLAISSAGLVALRRFQT